MIPGSGEFTVDAFHRGAFHVVQPKGRGHRSGIDAMLLAATVPEGFSGRLADLGAGAGAAGLAVAARCPGATVTLVENSDLMLECARTTLAMPENAGLAVRATVLAADVALDGRAREAAGLQRDAFDAVIMNPPFNAGRDRRSPDPEREAAHVMEDDLLPRWLKTACAMLKPGGIVAVIARPQSLETLLAASRGRFGAVSILPIHPHGDAPAIRIVLRGVKQSRAALRLLPGLVLHPSRDSGSFTPIADAINNGRATLPV